MRVLHVVKTSDGAWWAANQARELVRRGVEVHVALPFAEGRALPYWRNAGVQIHIVDLDFPVGAIWRLPSIQQAARRLVDRVKPDVIHSHFFGTTIVLRRALRRVFSGPIVFQVAGPLHLEHGLYRGWDLRSAGPNDYWIASSRCILKHYLDSGLPREKVFLSYHGGSASNVGQQRTNAVRNKLGISPETLVVGNVSFMYPPKRFLGQTIGVKCHEDMIDALATVTRSRSDVVGVFVGEAFFNAHWYQERLRARAAEKAGDRLRFTGYMSQAEIAAGWQDFDLAVHVPLSENCGGVLEPLLAGIPVIGGQVGGIPELVMDGLTGKLVESRNPSALADAVREVLSELPRYRQLAATGRNLVRTMFDVSRTAGEVYEIYNHLVDNSVRRPIEFDSINAARALNAGTLDRRGNTLGQVTSFVPAISKIID
jgi:glycosyltransferase involved in cell wall biosynthesis